MDPRPVLLPGLRLVRRDDDHLQIGLDAPRAVVLPDTDGVRRVVAALIGSGAPLPDDLTSARVLRDLAAAGLLTTARHRDALLAGAGDRPRPAVLAELVRRPRDAADVVRRRRTLAVGFRADEETTASLRRLLSGAGLAEGPDPALVLVAGGGEPDRETVDELDRADVPHLLVAGFADRVRIGPLVVPGETACLRCVDAHLAAHDPRRAVVLAQLQQDRTLQPSWDPTLLALGLAWAVRDATAYLDGECPSTWSASVTVDATLRVERRDWLRHPACGCAWGDALRVSPPS